MEVRLIGPEEAGRWDAFVSAQPGADVYHAYAWRAIFERSFGYRSYYLLASQDGQACGCLPLFRVATPFRSRLVAVPFRDRGGPLFDSPAALEALLDTAADLGRIHGAAFVEVKSLQPLPARWRERRYWIHSLASLRELTPEGMLERIGPKTRNMLRQAERAGAVYDPQAGLRDWYPVYLRSQRQLGLPPLPREFFRNLLERADARVHAVRVGGAPVACCIVLLHRKTAMYAYSASLAEARAARPNDFMVGSLFRWCLERGLETLDLGSDAPSQESLLFFKRKWLAVQTPIPSYSWGTVDEAAADSSHPRYKLVRAIFRKLPLPVLDLIGRVAARYFG